MKHLMSPEGEAAMRALIERGGLLGFDFDGTLSPNVTLPENASMPRSVGRGFAVLCEAMPVAVITGRSVADITPRLATMPKYLVGNHGAEGLPGQDAALLTRYQEICTDWMQQIEKKLRLQEIDPGLMIEHKPYSICLHYRLVRNRHTTIQKVEDALPRLSPMPLIIGGKCGINLLPPGAPHKRQALEDLLALEGMRSAFFVGDDETDEVVFRAAPPEWVTVRVERVRDSAARFFLHHQSEMAECLKWMIQFVKS